VEVQVVLEIKVLGVVEVVEVLVVIENLQKLLSGCYSVSPLNGNPGGTAVTSYQVTAYPIHSRCRWKCWSRVWSRYLCSWW
jgi:uncharacterized protein YceK